jgi:hypothetical protein
MVPGSQVIQEVLERNTGQNLGWIDASLGKPNLIGRVLLLIAFLWRSRRDSDVPFRLHNGRDQDTHAASWMEASRQFRQMIWFPRWAAEANYPSRFSADRSSRHSNTRMAHARMARMGCHCFSPCRHRPGGSFEPRNGPLIPLRISIGRCGPAKVTRDCQSMLRLPAGLQSFGKHHLLSLLLTTRKMPRGSCVWICGQ